MSFGGRFPGFDGDPFFSRPKSLFDDDPFFNRHRSFPSFPPMLGFPGMQQDQGRPDRPRHHRRGGDEVALTDPFAMFHNMDKMMNDMMQAPARGQGQFHSSSSVMHYSSVGNGPPKMYSASSSVTQGPGGVKETRKSESNSETGLKKMVIGHHIGDRGHVIERRHDMKKNKTEQHQEFINLDEDESEKFGKEWQDRTQRFRHQTSRGIHGNNRDHLADSRGLEGPGILPPLSEKDPRAAQRNDRRSRSPERGNLHHKSSKKHHDYDKNAARRREYMKGEYMKDKKVHF